MRNEIKWTILEEVDDAGDGHVFFHYAEGKGKDGKLYSGIAVMVDDNLEEIEDIEEIAGGLK
jgi:hypothetical protein